MSNKSDSFKFRQLIRHRCQYCGRDFFVNRQGGRPRLFCNKKCRDGEFRRLRYFTPKNGESASKNEGNSKSCRGIFGDRPLPFNILGGYRWPNSSAVDHELLQKIIRTEIGGRAP